MPPLSKFKEAAEAAHGNYNKIASIFQVTRQTVYNWCRDNSDFKEVVNDYKMKLYDQALDAARALVVGIPKISPDGRLLGWEEKPDSQMVRYILSTLGKDEGFTERKDITSNGDSLFPRVINLMVSDSADDDDDKPEE